MIQQTVTLNKKVSLDSGNNINNNSRSSLFSKSNIIIILLIFILITGIIALIYWILNAQKGVDKSNADVIGQQKTLNEEAKQYLSKLKNVLLIDSEESPIIAKVSDVEKIKTTNPEFYKNIKLGDIVFIFSYRVVIYRESENKIINIAPVVNNNSTQSSSSAN